MKMSAYFDPTDKYRFETKEEAIEYAENIGAPYSIVRLKELLYSDKPYMYVPQEGGAFSVIDDEEDIDDDE